MRPLTRSVVALGVGALLSLPPAATALQVAGTATLSVDPGTITSGEQIHLGGAVTTDDGCLGARAVEVQRRTAGEVTWTATGSTSTAADGTFAWSARPPHSASYRVLVAEETRGSLVCTAVLSSEVTSQVRAAVRAALDRTTLAAGRCASLSITVAPAKPGQQVQLEERVPSGWQALAPLTLNAASTASTSVCEPWSRIGETVTFRSRWVAQDARNLDGESPGASLLVRSAGWMRKIARLIGSRQVGVSVREAGTTLFARDAGTRRAPASNEKLLTTMAILDRLGPEFQFRTSAMATAVQNGVVQGDLWIVGSGDPSVGRSAMRALTASLSNAGVQRVEGRVRGSTGGFARDWFAPGWKRSFPREQVALPTALTFRGNQAKGRHIRNPERRAARFLTRKLRARGIEVGGRPGAGVAPGGLVEVAGVGSPSLRLLLRPVNRSSSNFFAEVLGKRLGAERFGIPGSIAKGAAAIEDWAASGSVDVDANDASGLSYANRVSPAGLTRLLSIAETESWGTALRNSLARPGQGTLSHRLGGVRVRAKTGTLTRVSALSGYVWLRRRGTWAEFSILSQGTSKSRAVRIENRIVRLLARSAG